MGSAPRRQGMARETAQNPKWPSGVSQRQGHGSRKQSGLGRPGHERSKREAQSWRGGSKHLPHPHHRCPQTWSHTQWGHLPKHVHWNLLETFALSEQHSLWEGQPHAHTHTEQNFVLYSYCPLSGWKSLNPVVLGNIWGPDS